MRQSHSSGSSSRHKATLFFVLLCLRSSRAINERLRYLRCLLLLLLLLVGLLLLQQQQRQQANASQKQPRKRSSPGFYAKCSSEQRGFDGQANLSLPCPCVRAAVAPTIASTFDVFPPTTLPEWGCVPYFEVHIIRTSSVTGTRVRYMFVGHYRCYVLTAVQPNQLP